MKYLVIEIQNTGAQISNIVTAHETRNDADSKYYSVLAAAAISEVPVHAAALLTEEGRCLKNDYYNHTKEDEDGQRPTY